jgi:preprotein translocase subunit YajC
MGGNFLYLMILLFGGMILFSILATRRDRKKRETMLGAVRKHDRVQTIGGVIGSVVDVKDNSIVLKVDESTNTRITFARSAVQQILSADTDTPGAAGLRNELEESAR